MGMVATQVPRTVVQEVETYTETFTRPGRSYTVDQPAIVQEVFQETYAAPVQTYAAPVQTYAAPTTSYAAPVTYPTTSYAAPVPTTYAAPVPTTYAAPVPTTYAPPVSYGAPTRYPGYY